MAAGSSREGGHREVMGCRRERNTHWHRDSEQAKIEDRASLLVLNDTRKDKGVPSSSAPNRRARGARTNETVQAEQEEGEADVHEETAVSAEEGNEARIIGVP